MHTVSARESVICEDNVTFFTYSTIRERSELSCAKGSKSQKR